MSDVYAAYELRRHISLKIISFHRYSMHLDATYVSFILLRSNGANLIDSPLLNFDRRDVQVSDVPRATFAADMD